MTTLFAILFAADTPPPPEGGPPGWTQLVPFLALPLFIWLLFLRPQRQQEKQRQDMVAKLKRNDRILNSGGIIGVVDSVKDKDEEIVLKGGLRITRSSVVKVLSPDETAKDQKDGGS